MTFEEALNLVPSHIILRSNTDKWQVGDEILGATYKDTNEPAWITPVESAIGSIIKSNLPCRRPIPETVRHSMARRVIEMKEDNDNKIIQSHPFESWLLEKSK